MTYHVNASGTGGAISESALTLKQAQTMAAEFKAKGYMSVVIVDAGTGSPVRNNAGGTTKAGSATEEVRPISSEESKPSSREKDD